MSAPRVALIGARRVRQGLGPFVARDLVALGAEVVAVLGTSLATLDEAAAQLEKHAGVRPPGYTDLDALLERESVDALAILSPAETHEAYLDAALEAGLHVLCEKPLIWSAKGPGQRGAELVRGFRERGLLLAENCQWPWSLPGFRRLHPDFGRGVPRQLGMGLSPDSSGLQGIGDSLPHVLSVVQAWVPKRAPRVENVVFDARGDTWLEVGFDYVAEEIRICCTAELSTTDAFPRSAWIEIDGRRAERHIELPDYTMQFRDGTRSIPLEDPLTARLAEFVGDLDGVMAGAAAPDPQDIADRSEMLDTISRAYLSEFR